MIRLPANREELPGTSREYVWPLKRITYQWFAFFMIWGYTVAAYVGRIIWEDPHMTRGLAGLFLFGVEAFLLVAPFAYLAGCLWAIRRLARSFDESFRDVSE